MLSAKYEIIDTSDSNLTSTTLIQNAGKILLHTGSMHFLCNFPTKLKLY
jgi:hypothetical protein